MAQEAGNGFKYLWNWGAAVIKNRSMTICGQEMQSYDK